MASVDRSNINTTSGGGGMEICPSNPYSLESTVLLGFVTPAIIMFGVVANGLNFRIFLHKLMRSSLLNWYLACLSLSDALILVTGFFFICLPRIGEYFDDVHSVNFANTLVLISYPIGLVAQTCSVWLTVVMSTHRFVGVCLPFQSGILCSRRNCRRALIGVFVFSLLFNATRFCEVKLTECLLNGTHVTMVQPGITSLRNSTLYTQVYMVWCGSIVMFFVPFALLIGLNTAVIVAIRNTQSMHKSLGADFSTTKKREIAKEISTSVMLVGVVVVFLVCNTLAFVVNVLEMIDSYRDEDDKQFVTASSFKTMVDVSNTLVMLNAAINIFVYSSFSHRFRFLLNYYSRAGCLRESQPLIDSIAMK